MYMPSFKLISQNMYKKSPENFSLAGALVTPPFKCSCPPEGKKLPNHDENQQGLRHLQYKCMYQIWGLNMISKAMNADKWLWPIFGCKVDQSVPIGMKLTCNTTYCMYIPSFKLISQNMEIIWRKWTQRIWTYRKTSNISRTLVGNKIVDHSHVVGASPVGAAPTTSSFST